MPRHLVVRSCTLVFLTLALLLTAPVWAAQGGESAPPAAQEQIADVERSSSDIGPIEERRLRFLFWAYNVIWIALAIYLVSLWIRLRSVQREMQRLDARLDRVAGGTSIE